MYYIFAILATGHQLLPTADVVEKKMKSTKLTTTLAKSRLFCMRYKSAHNARTHTPTQHTYHNALARAHAHKRIQKWIAKRENIFAKYKNPPYNTRKKAGNPLTTYSHVLYLTQLSETLFFVAKMHNFLNFPYLLKCCWSNPDLITCAVSRTHKTR